MFLDHSDIADQLRAFDVSRLIIPIRPQLLGLLSPVQWSVLEVLLALLILVMSFLQKSQDASHSSFSIVGVFSYFVLVFKASFATVIVLDGVYCLALGQEPRPIATVALFVIFLQQLRSWVFLQYLSRIVRGAKLPLVYFGELDVARLRGIERERTSRVRVRSGDDSNR